jgi:hypothetical protein
MDRFNWPYHNNDHYYNPVYQEDGQHTFQPETGQTSAGTAASGSYPAPDRSHLDPNMSAQIPSWPGPDWGTHAGPDQSYLDPNMSAQIPSWPGPDWGTHAGPDQSHLDPNMPAQIPSWPGQDWGTSQPTPLENIAQNDALPGPSNPQSAVKKNRRKSRAEIKAHFLASLEAFGRGVAVRKCSSSLQFDNYINSDGTMVNRGVALYNDLTSAEKTLLDQAIIARQGAKLEQVANGDTTTERFLGGLDNFEQGVKLANCSATIKFKYYVTDDGYLRKSGKELYNGMLPEDQDRVDRALLSRRVFHFNRAMGTPSVEERFLAGLDNYAQGVSLTHCSATLQFFDYASDKGTLTQKGRSLRANLLPEDQDRVDQALLSRSDFYLKQSMGKASVEERFLASLDNYANGVSLRGCSKDIAITCYLTDDGRLKQGKSVYDNLSIDDKRRVDQALSTRRKKAAEHISGDIPNFLVALVPYRNGLDLQECGRLSGLNNKAKKYFTEEGGLTPKGELLIENLPQYQRNEVLNEVEKRRQHMDLSAQLPEIPASMPEMGGMDPTAMYTPMQMEAMTAAAWQYTGQAMPGTWGIPSESAESSMPYYGSDVVGTNFQHRYNSNGLMPQRAPDRLIGRGIVHNMLINIQGEVYRVHDTGRCSLNPTNENPQGKIIMLVPRMQGG